MNQYDVIVIGGGPGGYLAAKRAAQGGLSVALFEKSALGGVCLNEGCVPSKTLLNSAKLYDHALHSEAYGVSAREVSIDHKQVVKRKAKVTRTLVSGVKASMKAHKVNVISKAAVVTGKGENGFEVKAEEESYFAGKLILACGSEPVKPLIPGVKEGLESGFIMTNREILEIEEIPKRLAIIGGGVIGLEMASYFGTVGSQVTVVEMLDKIAGPADREISDFLQTSLEQKNVTFLLGCQVTRVGDSYVEYDKDGKTETVEADVVLLSIGRRPVTDGVGFENLSLYLERGAVVTDEQMRTNVAGVYAVGDINAKIMLAHTAYREAEVAVNHILGKRDTMRYTAIPSVIYTAPEAAGVGETEESAKEKQLDFRIAKISMRYSGRFVAENEKGDGICKLLIENKSNRLIGVHLIGSYSSEIIYGAAMMVESHWPVDDIKEIVFPHPSVSEIIREALFV